MTCRYRELLVRKVYINKSPSLQAFQVCISFSLAMYPIASFAVAVSLVVLALGDPISTGSPVKREEVQIFLPPAFSPFSASSNYVGQNNGSLAKTNVTSGRVFDRFIQIWLENTDYQVAASTPEFQALAKEGLVLDSYYALTHVRCSIHKIIQLWCIYLHIL